MRNASRRLPRTHAKESIGKAPQLESATVPAHRRDTLRVMNGEMMSERLDGPKVVQLMRLLNALDEGNHSFESLKLHISEEKPPSTRTLRRYLADLASAGFPWHFDRARATYRFAEGYNLKRFKLNPRELYALLTLKRVGSLMGEGVAGQLDGIVAKMLGTIDGGETRAPAISIRFVGVGVGAAAERTLAELQDAERSGRRVTFAYIDKRGACSERFADPYGFVVSHGRIYMVAFDHARGDIRTFAVDNISNLLLRGERYAKPADFDLEAFTSQSISGLMHSEGEPQSITIRFAPIVAKAAAAQRVVSNQHADPQADGSIDITYVVADPEEVVRWSLGWGAQAEIRSPDVRRPS